MADTVIDSLTVMLKLDPSQYDAAQKKFLGGLHDTKEQAGKTAEELEEKGKQGASFFDQMSSSALKLGAVLLGGIGIKDFFKFTTQAGNASVYMAKNIGISTQQLMFWQNAIREVGGDTQQVGASFLGLSQALETIKIQGPGSSELIRAFQAIGVSAIDPLTGKLKTVAQLLPEIHNSKTWQDLSQQDKFFFGSKIGLTPDMINFLSLSDPLYQKYTANVNAAGQATSEQLKATQDLTAAWGNMWSFIDRIGYEFAGEIDPIITKTIEGITSLGEALDKVGDNYSASDLGAFIGGVAGMLVGGPIGAAAGVIIGGSLGAAVSRGQPTSGTVGLHTPGGGGQGASGAGADRLFGLIQQLEGGKEGSVTPTGLPNDPYAYGKNQITLGTARLVDPSATATKLLDGSYNDAMARKIEAQYSAKYGGNLDAIALAYHNGPGAADKFVASGGSTSGLGPQTLAYLARERALSGNAGGTTTTTTTIGTIQVNAPHATDAAGIAGAIRSELSNNQLLSQGNAGPQ